MLTRSQLKKMSLGDLATMAEKLTPVTPETQEELDKINREIKERLNL